MSLGWPQLVVIAWLAFGFARLLSPRRTLPPVLERLITDSGEDRDELMKIALGPARLVLAAWLVLRATVVVVVLHAGGFW